jgi:hypothetical protein
MLEDAGVDHGMTRFTDQDGVDFDLSEHDAREWGGDHGDGDGDEGGDGDDDQPNYAAGGDTPEDDPNTTDMTDDDPDGGDGATDAKALAEQNSEQISELTDSVKELTESITGPEPKTAEIQIDGETYEVREDAAKAALGVGDDVDVEEAIQRLNEKASRVDDLEQRIETISRQSGRSTQLEASRDGDGGGGEDNEGGLEDLGKVLS